MPDKPLLYSHYDTVFQEVPGEVSLAIDITGCPYRCPGCHSSYLQNYFGSELLKDLPAIIEKYNGMITCVLFMGGDQNRNALTIALAYCKLHKLKTCVYTGAEPSDATNLFRSAINIGLVDYLKAGPYKQELGGLASETTNQVFYRICKTPDGEILLKNETSQFQKKVIK